MPLSNSVLRRYTPPTCTLEIAAKSSPLSRWAGKSMLKNLRFELRFDDPRHSEEQRVTIRGNAQDLEILSEAINSYIQNFLGSSSVLPLTAGTSANNGNSTPAHHPNGNAHLPLNVNTPDQIISQASEEQAFENAVSANHSPAFVHPFQHPTPTEIYLQPKGLLAHELFLGQLATAESGLSVDLSVLQLFDLATALDEYTAEVVALPKLNNPLPWKKSPPAWTSAAAMVVLAVGVTGGVAYFNQQNKSQITAAKSSQPTPALTPLSPLPVPVPPVAISPLPTPVVPPSLAASPRLLPPTPVGIPAPGTIALPPGVPTPNPSVNSSPGAIELFPKRPTITPRSGIPLLPAPSIAQKNGADSTVASNPTQPALPKAPTAPPALNLPRFPSSQPSGSVSTAQVPPTSGSGARGIGATEVNPSDSSQATGSTGSLSPNGAKTRLSDTIPQVAEARSYLEQRWKPPSASTPTLEYYLILSADGSIQRIIPLGNAANNNIDQTGIPKPGDSFVSPVSGGGNPKIRAVFTPDGKVSTFLDQTN